MMPAHRGPRPGASRYITHQQILMPDKVRTRDKYCYRCGLHHGQTGKQHLCGDCEREQVDKRKIIWADGLSTLDLCAPTREVFGTGIGWTREGERI